MKKNPIEIQEQDPIYSQLLCLCLAHNLTRDDFYFLSGKKRKEKRVDARTASEVLLRKTYLKNLRICLHTNINYFYPPFQLFGPFTTNQIRLLLTQILEKVKVEDLIKPYYVDQVFKSLKCNSKVAVTGPVLLKGLNTKET